jgi:hypothetical protein
MKYMLLIYEDEKAWASLSEAERQRIMAAYRQLSAQFQTGGNYVTGSQLAPTTAATSVRVHQGKRLLTDGPFAETKEQLGGYYVIQAKDLDEALALAAQVPAAVTGTVEVRPLIEGPAPA